MNDETLRSLQAVAALDGHRLALTWEGGQEAEVDLASTISRHPFKALTNPKVFMAAQLGDWGHSVVWPDGIEIGADSLWLDSLSAWGREDTRAFLEWRLRNGLSLNAAGEALGLSRRTIAYYSGGRTVPRSILLACKGWDALKAA